VKRKEGKTPSRSCLAVGIWSDSLPWKTPSSSRLRCYPCPSHSLLSRQYRIS